MLQSVTECYRVLQSVTACYRVFLAHLLGPIFGLGVMRCYDGEPDIFYALFAHAVKPRC